MNNQLQRLLAILNIHFPYYNARRDACVRAGPPSPAIGPPFWRRPITRWRETFGIILA